MLKSNWPPCSDYNLDLVFRMNPNTELKYLAVNHITSLLITTISRCDFFDSNLRNSKKRVEQSLRSFTV